MVLAHTARGDLGAAAGLYPALHDILVSGFRIGTDLHSTGTLVAIAAAAGEDWPVAEAHFRSELDFVDRIGYGLAKPTVQRWYAWMLLRRAAPGDRDQARALLDEAIASFRTIGMILSLGHAEALRASLDG